MSVDLSVIVLAYNEQDNVGPVLEELQGWLSSRSFSSEIVFVDDGSSDHTLTRAKETLDGFPSVFVSHPVNRGMGAGIKSAVTVANGAWATFVPADGQIPPDAIGILWNGRGHADVVLSVYDDRDDGLHRKVLSMGVRALIVGFHGVRVRSDGPYLFRRNLLVPEQLLSNSFFLNFEFPIRVKAAGIQINTVTVSCRRRLSGQSKAAGLTKIKTVASELWRLRQQRIKEFVRRGTGI